MGVAEFQIPRIGYPGVNVYMWNTSIYVYIYIYMVSRSMKYMEGKISIYGMMVI